MMTIKTEGIHQDIGIGVCQKMKKRNRKIVEVNIGLFVSDDDRIQKIFDLKKNKNKDVFFSSAFSCRIIQV